METTQTKRDYNITGTNPTGLSKKQLRTVERVQVTLITMLIVSLITVSIVNLMA